MIAHLRKQTGSPLPTLVASLLFLGILAIFLFLLFFRRVNLDEGWYLGAARLVYSGELLYRDFAYTQTPLLPYIYGLWQLLWGIGLYQGRILTILLSLVAWLLSAVSAYRVGGWRAALFCLALLLTSVFAAMQYTYTATYALTACLMAAAIDISLCAWPERRRTILAALLMSLAVTVRLSTVVALPPFLLYLVLRSRQRWQMLLWAGLTTGVTLGLVLGTFWLLSGDLMFYDIWGFHLDRILRTKWRLEKIRLRTVRTAIDFAVPLLLCGVGSWWSIRRLVRPKRQALATLPFGVTLALTLMAGTLFVAHIVPRTTDSYYTSLQLPMMSTVGGIVLALLYKQLGRPLAYLLPFSFLLCNGAFQGYATWRDGALTWPPQNQVAVVRHAAQLVQRYTASTATLLTFNQHLALEAKRSTLPGYEMGIFSYRPTWHVEEAHHYKVINNDLLFADLAAGQGAAAFTEFDLGQIYGERERFFTILHDHYRWFYTVENFGPFGDVLNLYVAPQFQAPQPQVHQEWQLDDGITLLGYDFVRETQANEPVLKVGLYWHSAETPSNSYTVFVQLLDQNGAFVWGWDNPPCRRTCPTASWQPGEFIRDEYTVPLAGLLPVTTYTLITGMYDPNTGQRLVVHTADGVLLGDYIELTTLQP
ncbi:MAG: glycosyltransferase family 87 protein [Caldilineaceae bacterium]